MLRASMPRKASGKGYERRQMKAMIAANHQAIRNLTAAVMRLRAILELQAIKRGRCYLHAKERSPTYPQRDGDYSCFSH
jgi:hypothetical protein